MQFCRAIGLLPKLNKPVVSPKIYATVDEVNSTVQNCHCVNSAQFLALMENLHEKGILDDEDAERINKRKLYWISQMDQMIAQAKDDAMQEVLKEFLRKKESED